MTKGVHWEDHVSPLRTVDWKRWYAASDSFASGQLVRIINQPYYVRDPVLGKLGILLNKTGEMEYIKHLYWDVVVEGKVHVLHYKSFEPIHERQKNED